MSRTKDIEDEERKRRDEQTGRLQDWATELQALGQMLWDADSENGWTVPAIKVEPQLTVLVMRNGSEFARFVRDEHGITGVFGGSGEPKRYTDKATAKQTALDDCVKRRVRAVR